MIMTSSDLKRTWKRKDNKAKVQLKDSILICILLLIAAIITGTVDYYSMGGM